MRRNEKIVYKVTNKVNNKSYIGWCVDFKERKARHLNAVKRGVETHFYNAIRKYGEANFDWVIVYENLQSVDECKLKEKELIKKYDSYDNGYNSTLGGDGGDTFSKLSEERKILFKMKCSENSAKIWKGKKLSAKHIENLKNADRSEQYVPVIQLELSGDVIKEWASIKEASIGLGISNHISAVCKGNRKTCGGFIWKYK